MWAIQIGWLAETNVQCNSDEPVLTVNMKTYLDRVRQRPGYAAMRKLQAEAEAEAKCKGSWKDYEAQKYNFQS